MDKRKVGKKVDICLFSVLISLILYVAFMSYVSVIALAISFAAYFIDQYASIKPQHRKDIMYYEEELEKMKAKVNKISIKMGFGS